ncbi:hypothetical protein NPA08_02040 [Mycoplasmopsis citelli]|uniref:30S ribosomal protein S1 n=1 Tax=Mycoplasmopsis citelli TaxID=171281 RepID=A0A449B0Z9_9BACT|nr:hypothetical protein [Mycoplasmopsis citelli]UUD36587.1 hypothetical protein NPA08_02040 [Mycoplasmopsis citelli]VEU74224.1 Uncharacterised protein [Mycoplasmopsis citelli]
MNKRNYLIGKGRVIKVTDLIIKVSTAKGEIYTIKADQITNHPNVKIKNIFKVNDFINFYITFYNHKTKNGTGSFIMNHPNYCVNPFSFALEETKNGFDNLLNYTLEDINGNT